MAKQVPKQKERHQQLIEAQQLIDELREDAWENDYKAKHLENIIIAKLIVAAFPNATAYGEIDNDTVGTIFLSLQDIDLATVSFEDGIPDGLTDIPGISLSDEKIYGKNAVGFDYESLAGDDKKFDQHIHALLDIAKKKVAGQLAIETKPENKKVLDADQQWLEKFPELLQDAHQRRHDQHERLSFVGKLNEDLKKILEPGEDTGTPDNR